MDSESFLLGVEKVYAPHSFGYRLKLLSQLTTRRFQEQLDPLGLTPFHWVVLCCLWQEDGMATCKISEKLQQVGGTLTGVLTRMEERGLVHREQDPQDRRVWRIWLTDTGRELQGVLPPLVAQMYVGFLAGFSAQEQDQLSKFLDRLIDNVLSVSLDT